MTSNSRGFTLLEQVIIIAVLGVFAVIAIPNVLRMLDRAKVDQAIAELRGALDETQREAMRNNQICTLTLNLVAGEITGTCLPAGNRKISSDLDIATNLIQAADITSNDRLYVAQTGKSKAIQLFQATEQHFEQHRQTHQAVVQTDVGMDLGLQDAASPRQVALLTANPAKPPTAPPAASAGVVVEVISNQTDSAPMRYPIILAMGGEGGNPPPDPPPDLPPESPPDPPSTTPDIPIRFGGVGSPEFAIATSTSIPTDPSAKIVLYLSNKPGIPKRCVAISNSLGLIRVGRYEGSTEPAEITDSGSCRAEDWQAQ